MTISERQEFMTDIRRHLESGKLNAETFADLALMYASFNDPSLNGDRLKKYEARAAWAAINAQVDAEVFRAESELTVEEIERQLDAGEITLEELQKRADQVRADQVLV